MVEVENSAQARPSADRTADVVVLAQLGRLYEPATEPLMEAFALQFGLCAGIRATFTPARSSNFVMHAAYTGSRSRMKCVACRRNPLVRVEHVGLMVGQLGSPRFGSARRSGAR